MPVDEREIEDLFKGIKWERAVEVDGSFSKNDTGKLTITLKDENPEQLLQSTYISITRMRDEKRDELCSSVREILLKKFHPMSEDECFKLAVNDSLELSIPLPIMLKDGDKIFIYQFNHQGKPCGITFRVEVKK